MNEEAVFLKKEKEQFERWYQEEKNKREKAERKVKLLERLIKEYIGDDE